MFISAVVFSSLTPHRTGPIRTDQVRKAYIVQYAPTGAQIRNSAHPHDLTLADDDRRQYRGDSRR